MIIERIGAQFRKPTGIGGVLSAFMMNRMNRRQYTATEHKLSLTDGERILDVGFGNGFMLQRLSKRYNCGYFGIEIADDMITAANKRNAQAIAGGRIKLALGDIVKTSFEDGYFDKVYTVNTAYFWSNLEAGLSEINRVLKGGGMFVNTVYSKEWLERLPFTRVGFAKYSIEELRQAGEKCGFTVRITPITNGKSYTIIYVKRKNEG